MKKSALTVLLLLTACQNESSEKNTGILDRIKIFLGLTQPDIPLEDTRSEGRTRIIPEIQSSVSDGNWTGGELASSDQSSVADGPGRIISESGYKTGDIEKPIERPVFPVEQNNEEKTSTDSSMVQAETMAEPSLPKAAIPENTTDTISAQEDAVNPVAAGDMPPLVYGPDMSADENTGSLSGSAEKNLADVSPQDKPWSSAGLEYGFSSDGTAQQPASDVGG